MRLNKTQHRLIERTKRIQNALGFTGYHGRREADAVYRLEAMGLVEVRRCEGVYWRRNRVGDYIKGYCPQGTFKLTHDIS